MKSSNPTHPLDICRLYRDWKDKIIGTLRARFEPSSLSDQDLEDIVQDLFVQLQKRETQISGQHSFGSLLTRAVRDALDFLRRRNSQKRGGKILSSLEKALEDGFEFPATDMTPMTEALEIADLVIASATPILSEREIILIRHIRQAAPHSELSLSDLVSCLGAEERLRMLPLHRACSAQDEDTLLIKQVSRSRSALFRRLKRVRDELGDQGL